MSLFLSTVSETVTIKDLGMIELVHPTTNFPLGSNFDAYELETSKDLPRLLSEGKIILKNEDGLSLSEVDLGIEIRDERPQVRRIEIHNDIYLTPRSAAIQIVVAQANNLCIHLPSPGSCVDMSFEIVNGGNNWFLIEDDSDNTTLRLTKGNNCKCASDGTTWYFIY